MASKKFIDDLQFFKMDSPLPQYANDPNVEFYYMRDFRVYLVYKEDENLPVEIELQKFCDEESKKINNYYTWDVLSGDDLSNPELVNKLLTIAYELGRKDECESLLQ